MNGQSPMTPRCKKALELTLHQALSLGNNYIGTEHLLLGLIREGEGVAMKILLDAGAEAEAVREAVLAAMKKRFELGRDSKTGKWPESDSSRQDQSLSRRGPACSQCGAIMELAGQIFVCASCGNTTHAQLYEDVQVFLAAWHQAARDADEELFFSMMAEGATFVGTDDGEIWSKAAFREASKQKFEAAPAWSMTQTHLRIAWISRTTVCFVELLESERLGPCRGSGCVQMKDGAWKVMHYVLSFSVPNDAIDAVKAAVSQPQTP